MRSAFSIQSSERVTRKTVPTYPCCALEFITRYAAGDASRIRLHVTALERKEKMSIEPWNPTGKECGRGGWAVRLSKLAAGCKSAARHHARG